ncbi:DNA mismatch repair protein MutS [Bizionia argentinensis JUB59]|uniref:DNA mismatch repair protein MutS n=1 Tax=Bizionia argentinensis JUB59 TaxID=1046627 RepID=G2ECB3_9FLAO|nr:Smr/MutS family protein [Bizionia argentinensis]EGV43896.1 DNA mismatch repair protein MutS [Bizionia argentinensis JUB59]
MMFKVGDAVAVLDDDLSGIITKIKGENITIETPDGFELDFEPRELVITKPLKIDLNISEAFIREKEQPKRKPSVSKKSKEKYQPTMEVDLHIHHLTENFKRMSNHDMLTLQLDTARGQLEFAIKKRIQKMVFIHGVGEGVLKTELEYLLGRYNNVKYYDADFKKYGIGATEVYIYQNVSTY